MKRISGFVRRLAQSILHASFVCLIAAYAMASGYSSGVVQIGSITAGHAVSWAANGQIQDAGGAAGSGTVTSAQVSAGTGIGISGTCTITTSGNCTVSAALSSVSNSLGADVLMTSTSNYFNGPSVTQGTSGTWFASGTVTLVDTAGGGAMNCRLWDGTTVIASAGTATTTANFYLALSLSGIISSPAANIRISCKDISSTSGKILFNATGNSKDSTLTAVEIH